MPSVSVNPPKTPVTEGSNGVAAATLPNVCKMPGPPAPFVPTPLPNIGKSALSPQGYSQTVTIEGHKVAIRGATFKSMGDVASQGTGGGLISSNVEGPTSFVGPGSLDVQIEGKNVHLLGDPMLNNGGAGGSPPNAATMMGVLQANLLVTVVEDDACPLCQEHHGAFEETSATKADAGVLAEKFRVRVEAASARIQTMLGVVVCKCGQKFADQSAVTTQELCAAADDATMKHQAGVDVSLAASKSTLDQKYLESLEDKKKRMGDLLGGGPQFNDAWEEGEEAARRSSKKRSGPASYPPGTCAAQKVLILVREDGGLAAAMTERWYSSSGGETQAPVAFIDNRQGARKPDVAKFPHEATVPPCGTCVILVPLLLCPQDEVKCSHPT
jgi:hypothetical protein